MGSPRASVTSLVKAGIALRVGMHLLLLATSYFSPFDASHTVQFPLSADAGLLERWSSTALRWDAFHFAGIAAKGYFSEQSWAFFPWTPLLLRMASKVTSNRVLSAGVVSTLANICSVSSIHDLYHLTLLHTNSHQAAYLAAALSLLPSSPITLSHALYAEPFFTFLAYRGMLYSARKQWNLAALCFHTASAFRSNGVLLAGFLLWGMIIEPLLLHRRLLWTLLPHSLLLSMTVLLPFLGHQYAAYTEFCVGVTEQQPEWCHQTLPLIYSYVQRKYWRSGFLLYWEVPQIPNFIIAAPPLALLFWGSITHLKSIAPSLPLQQPASGKVESSTPQHRNVGPLVTSTSIPHAIHALVFALLMLFASHVQIILRLASSLPFLYWSSARLLLEHPTLGKWWIGWSIIWGLVNILNWSVFLPPA